MGVGNVARVLVGFEVEVRHYLCGPFSILCAPFAEEEEDRGGIGTVAEYRTPPLCTSDVVPFTMFIAAMDKLKIDVRSVHCTFTIEHYDQARVTDFGGISITNKHLRPLYKIIAVVGLSLYPLNALRQDTVGRLFYQTLMPLPPESSAKIAVEFGLRSFIDSRYGHVARNLLAVQWRAPPWWFYGTKAFGDLVRKLASECSWLSVDELLKMKVGFVPHTAPKYRWLTALERLLWTKPDGLHTSIREQLRELTGRFPLWPPGIMVAALWAEVMKREAQEALQLYRALCSLTNRWEWEYEPLETYLSKVVELTEGVLEAIPYKPAKRWKDLGARGAREIFEADIEIMRGAAKTIAWLLERCFNTKLERLEVTAEDLARAINQILNWMGLKFLGTLIFPYLRERFEQLLKGEEQDEGA